MSMNLLNDEKNYNTLQAFLKDQGLFGASTEKIAESLNSWGPYDMKVKSAELSQEFGSHENLLPGINQALKDKKYTKQDLEILSNASNGKDFSVTTDVANTTPNIATATLAPSNNTGVQFDAGIQNTDALPKDTTPGVCIPSNDAGVQFNTGTGFNNDFQDKIDSVESHVNALESKLGIVNTDISGVKSDFYGKIDSVENRISTLNSVSENAALNAQNAQNAVNDLAGNFGSLTESNQVMQSNIQQLSQEAARNTKELHSKIGSVEDNVDQLESALESTNINAEEMQGVINGLTGDVESFTHANTVMHKEIHQLATELDTVAEDLVEAGSDINLLTAIAGTALAVAVVGLAVASYAAHTSQENKKNNKTNLDDLCARVEELYKEHPELEKPFKDDLKDISTTNTEGKFDALKEQIASSVSAIRSRVPVVKNGTAEEKASLLANDALELEIENQNLQDKASNFKQGFKSDGNITADAALHDKLDKQSGIPSLTSYQTLNPEAELENNAKNTQANDTSATADKQQNNGPTTNKPWWKRIFGGKNQESESKVDLSNDEPVRLLSKKDLNTEAEFVQQKRNEQMHENLGFIQHSTDLESRASYNGLLYSFDNAKEDSPILSQQSKLDYYSTVDKEFDDFAQKRGSNNSLANGDYATEIDKKSAEQKFRELVKADSASIEEELDELTRQCADNNASTDINRNEGLNYDARSNSRLSTIQEESEYETDDSISICRDSSIASNNSLANSDHTEYQTCSESAYEIDNTSLHSDKSFASNNSLSDDNNQSEELDFDSRQQARLSRFNKLFASSESRDLSAQSDYASSNASVHSNKSIATSAESDSNEHVRQSKDHRHFDGVCVQERVNALEEAMQKNPSVSASGRCTPSTTISGVGIEGAQLQVCVA